MLDTQNCLQNRMKNAKATKFLSQSPFYGSKGRTCKVLSFYDFWFKFSEKFCSPNRIVDFLRIFNHQSREPYPWGGEEVKALNPKNQSFCNRYSLKKLYIRNKRYEGHNSIHFLKLSSRPIQKLTFGGCCCQSNTNIQHQI